MIAVSFKRYFFTYFHHKILKLIKKFHELSKDINYN